MQQLLGRSLLFCHCRLANWYALSNPQTPGTQTTFSRVSVSIYRNNKAFADGSCSIARSMEQKIFVIRKFWQEYLPPLTLAVWFPVRRIMKAFGDNPHGILARKRRSMFVNHYIVMPPNCLICPTWQLEKFFSAPSRVEFISGMTLRRKANLLFFFAPIRRALRILEGWTSIG